MTAGSPRELNSCDVVSKRDTRSLFWGAAGPLGKAWLICATRKGAHEQAYRAVTKGLLLPADIPRGCKESTEGLREAKPGGSAPSCALQVLFAPISQTWGCRPQPQLCGRSLTRELPRCGCCKGRASASVWVLVCFFCLTEARTHSIFDRGGETAGECLRAAGEMGARPP